MTYRILWALEGSYFKNGDGTPSIKYMALHFVEIPFVRQHPAEWQYLTNWHARRDKNYMNAEKAPESWKQ